jgi:hypothetical protein
VIINGIVKLVVKDFLFCLLGVIAGIGVIARMVVRVKE